MTERFLEQNVGERGSEAVDSCLFEARIYESVFAGELDFSEVRIEGAKAEASFDVTGGAADGSTVTIELVHDRDQWKLDRFTGMEIDRARFDQALYDTSLEEGTTPREARCLVDQTRRMSTTAELEREALETDFTDPPDPTVLCLSRETLLRFFEEGFREGVATEEAAEDLPKPILGCILNRFTERLSVPQLRTILSAGDTATRYMDRLGESAGKACVREYEAGVLGEQPRL